MIIRNVLLEIIGAICDILESKIENVNIRSVYIEKINC